MNPGGKDNMAINKNNSLSGLIGPVVVYKLNGKDVIRIRPRKYKKSKASQNAAKQFGLASKMSAQLRRQLYRSLEGINQRSMRYRFDGVIQEWLRHGKPGDSDSGSLEFSFIEQFQFNEKTSLAEKLRVRVSITWSRPGKIILNIPAMIPIRDMAAPQNTELVHWIIEASRTSLVNPPGQQGYAIANIDIKYNKNAVKAQTLEINFTLKKAELIVVVLALKYTTNRNGDRKILADDKWLPAAVIGSYYQHKD